MKLFIPATLQMMLTPAGDIKRKLILIVTGLLLFVLMLAMPRPNGITPEGQRMAAVAILMALWWIGEVVPIAVTALIPLVLYPLLGIMPSKNVAPNYGNHLIFLFLGGFMIALAMEKWNLHKRIALTIILKVGTSPQLVIFGFMTATAFLSMWISNTATTMMMLPVAMAVVRQIASQTKFSSEVPDSLTVEKNLGLALMLGLAYSASIGGVGTLIGTPPNIIFAGFFKNSFPERPDITFLGWMLMALPVVVIFLPLVWWYLCRFCTSIPISKIKVDDSAHEIVGKELKSLGPMNLAEKWIAGVFGTTAFLWMFRKSIDLGPINLQGWSGIFPWPEYLHDSTVAMLMGLFLMIAPIGLLNDLKIGKKREFFLLDWPTVQSGIPWGLLLLFGGGFALASGFKATNLDQWIGQQLSGVETFPLWGIILILCLGITFLTEMTSNTATATMIFPIIAGAAVAGGLDPLMLMVPVTISSSFAFMMPVATPPNAIVFGSGWVTIPKMSRAGFILNIIGAGLVTLLAMTVVKGLL